MNIVTLIAVPFAVSLFVCWLMIRLGPKDGPDGGRKTQAAPVASSGGVGVLAGVIVAVLAMALQGAPALGLIQSAPLAGVVVFAMVAALIGWADDVYGWRATTKFAALLAAALAAVTIGPQPETVWIGGQVAIPLALGIAGSATLMFVMANAVNFMDGANGIAMGTALIILTFLGMLLAPNAIYSLTATAPGMLMALVLSAAAALGGFLVWNLRGQLFAGDAGALSVGGLIGGATAMFAMIGPVLVPLTLCLPILIDVFFTLAWRARKGRPLMQAHRDHAYQLLLRAGWQHGQVARLWWGMTVMCGGAVLAGPFAAATGAYGFKGPPLDILAFAAVLLIGSALWVRQRVTLGRRLEAEGV